MSAQPLVSQHFFFPICCLKYFTFFFFNIVTEQETVQLFVTTKCWFWKTSFLSLDLCKWDWFENCHASKIILFLQCSFQFSKKHAIWWKWLSQCYFCPGDQNMFQVKTNKKKRCRAGTYTFLVGKNLSLFRTLTEVMIVICMRQKKKKLA